MQPYRNHPRNNFYFGAFLGLIFPIAGFLLFWIFAFSSQMSLQQYWDSLFTTDKISSALSLAIVTNLPVFFLLIWRNWLQASRGVIGATLFYGLLIIIFKFN